MLYGISEQDGDGIVPYGLNMSIDLVYDQCYPLHARTQVFVLRLFWLLLIQ